MRIAVTFGCSAARASRRSPVPSVDPSSTKITSYSPDGSDCSSSEAMHGSIAEPGLYTGTTTLTFGGATGGSVGDGGRDRPLGYPPAHVAAGAAPAQEAADPPRRRGRGPADRRGSGLRRLAPAGRHLAPGRRVPLRAHAHDPGRAAAGEGQGGPLRVVRVARLRVHEGPPPLALGPVVAAAALPPALDGQRAQAARVPARPRRQGALRAQRRRRHGRRREEP